MTAIASTPAQAIAQRRFEPVTGELATSKASTPPKIDAVPNTATASAEWDDDESSIAAQRLADFFNGEVLRLQEDSFTQPTTSSLISPPNYDGYDTSAEEETDFDF